MSEVYIRSQNKEKLYRLGGNYACVEYGEYEDIKKKRVGLVKVKAQRRFLDKELNQIKDTGDVYTVSRERAAVLKEAGVVEVAE